MDVVSRSQRGRICEYSREKGGPKLSMPAVLSGDGQNSVRLEDSVRVLDILGVKIVLDDELLVPASSGIYSEHRISDGVTGMS